MPKDWSELSQEQLRFFFLMLDVESSMEAVMTRCFFKWGGISVIGRVNDSSLYILRKGRKFFSISSESLWQWMAPIRWLEKPPSSPVVLERYGRNHAVNPLFRGVPFGSYLACAANWSDMTRSGKMDNQRLLEMCAKLYGFRPKKLLPEFISCIIYWMSSLQEYFSNRFKDLFAPVASSDGQGSLGSASHSFQDSVNAMIRALTKGDVLKEKEVLEIDTWRALIELDAQAKESRQINDSIKRK